MITYALLGSYGKGFAFGKGVTCTAGNNRGEYPLSQKALLIASPASGIVNGVSCFLPDFQPRLNSLPTTEVGIPKSKSAN